MSSHTLVRLTSRLMKYRYGTYSTVEAIKAGLDLEMPGRSASRGPLVTKALSSGKLS